VKPVTERGGSSGLVTVNNATCEVRDMVLSNASFGRFESIQRYFRRRCDIKVLSMGWMSGGMVGIILWNSIEATRDELVDIAQGFCKAMCEYKCQNEEVGFQWGDDG
jgi:hypothetical protein